MPILLAPLTKFGQTDHLIRFERIQRVSINMKNIESDMDESPLYTYVFADVYFRIN